MNRNERPFRPVPWRLSSAAWCGIFGQCACCLTESTALIDRERLKRHFQRIGDFRRLSLELLAHQTAFPRKNKLASSFREDR